MQKEIITEKEIGQAAALLKKYKQAKDTLDRRIVSNEDWFRMRSKRKNELDGGYSSGWLFNSIAIKHSDAMDSIPCPSVLPREEGDIEDAQALSEILPVILEQSGFSDSYDRGWWRKLKAGTAVYSVVWNARLHDGMGDIDIKPVDILNLFWEAGVNDIQRSRNVFHIELWDSDLLKMQYPQLEESSEGTAVGKEAEALKYIHDTTADTANKTAVVDWYYKKNINDKSVLHYCKFANGKVLFSSENSEEYKNGFYEHGEYPFVFDPLFVQEGSPAGFSLIDIMKDCQLYIDKLNEIVLENAAISGRKRFFVKDMAGINEDEFRDWSRDLIHCTTAQLGADSIREMEVSPLPSSVLSVLQMKIDELKEISGNRDVSQGGVSGGVTAASAIAALQEAGSKLSRDMIGTSFRAFTRICIMCIELIRQFYNEPRYFRILGKNGDMRFIGYSNSKISTPSERVLGVELAPRKSVFDIKVSAQKSSPFSRISQNELAKELYSLGIFNPENKEQALALLEMMDFDGKQIICDRIANGIQTSVKQQSVNPQKASSPLDDAYLLASKLKSEGRV